MQLSDPTVAEIHATISPHAKGLSIQVLDKTHDLRINKASVQESLLKHGDVIEIGTTRLFVQSQQTPGAWESLTQLRKWRKWMTVVLPVLFIAIIAAIIHSCRPEASAPKSDSAPLHTPLYTRPDTNNTDWVVTNVPQILIDPSVILTTSPTEIMDAKETLMAARTNNIQEEIDASRTELEFASHFLTEARKQNSDAQPPSDATLSKTILQQAEESLGITTAAPAQS